MDHRGLIVDNFAGGGGASTGIEAALGRGVDLAINHDPDALRMHLANHPGTRHLTEDVWKASKRIDELVDGRAVDLAWFSPDCTHFSRARGAKPKEKKIRGLAWTAVRWAKSARPRVIVVENVREFLDWGPLDKDDQPVPGKKGLTFRKWVGNIRNLGYKITWQVLDAADYGAPTHRRRLFVIARCDGGTMEWPRATHGPGRRHPWRAAAEIIDWSLDCPSIFSRKRPLVEATMRRIANGVKRYVIEAQQPFIVRTGHYSNITGKGGQFRGQPLTKPLSTVTSKCDFNLVVPHISQFFGGMVGKDVRDPLPTVTHVDHNALVQAFLTKHGVKGQVKNSRADRSGQVQAFLLKYYGTATGSSLYDPVHTITGKHRFGLVMVEGQPYHIHDIGMRMLQPHELAAAQGFPLGYELTGTKANQIAKVGNSVPPPLAEAVVRANLPQYAQEAVA